MVQNSQHGVPGSAESFWIASAPGKRYPSLKEDLSVDVAVLGGGIAGITTAFLLKRGGAKVALVEAFEIVRGVTGHTTAHISSSSHLSYYKHLADGFGEAKAKLCADSGQSAIERIAGIVKEQGIDCAFRRTSEFLYASSRDDVHKLKQEYEVVKRLGLPVSFMEKPPVPIENYGAIRFEEQAEFHPRQYLLPLASAIDGDGSHVFEHTRARGVKEGEPCTVTTSGGRIKARDVVVATHFPILNNGFLFARMKPMRSYVLGIRVEGEIPDDMYYSTEDPCHYIRTQRTPEGQLVIVGGEDHTTGHVIDTVDRYRKLKKYCDGHFRVKSVDYSWSTQDNYPFDELPFIGRIAPEDRHIFVATGFKGTGMTYGTLAGMVLSDLILKGRSPYEELYDPKRLKLTVGGPELIAGNLKVAQELISGKLVMAEDASKIPVDDAAISTIGEERAAVYKDDSGKIHAVSPVCTHLGCQVNWNNAERSWDCPCHGSRYKVNGDVLHSPTVINLREIEKK